MILYQVDLSPQIWIEETSEASTDTNMINNTKVSCDQYLLDLRGESSLYAIKCGLLEL